MNPNANLDEVRRILERWREDEAWSADPDRLPELVEALDRWITKGGALPVHWRLAACRPATYCERHSTGTSLSDQCGEVP